MAAFVLVHGAGDVGWYWHLVTARLRARGHDTVAPDLPCADDSAGLPEYTDAVVAAAGDRTGVVLVAQSLGGFVAPLVCARVPVSLIVLVAPMIPAPGEAPADYWSNTRYADEPRESYDDLFYHDVAPELVARARTRSQGQSEARMGEPSPLRAWPDVPTRVLLCRDDHLLPPGFVRRVARERLGVTPDEIDGGHTPALSRPAELADRLEAYAAALDLGLPAIIDPATVMSEWVRANTRSEPLYPELELRTSPPDRSKQSAWVGFVHPDVLGAVTAWDTGECEVELAWYDPGHEDLVRTTSVRSAGELVALLDAQLRRFL
jgi:alpha/beta hydrolase family protein